MTENKCVSCSGTIAGTAGGTFMGTPVCGACGDVLSVAQDRIFAGESGPTDMEHMVCSDTDAFRRKQAAVKKMGWDRAKQEMDRVVSRVMNDRAETP